MKRILFSICSGLILLVLVSASGTYATESIKQPEAIIEALPIQRCVSKSEEQVNPDTKLMGLNRYEIKHEADNKKYWLSITKDDNDSLKLTLFDKDKVELQSFYSRIPEVNDVWLNDLNSDGYTDIMLGWDDIAGIQKGYNEAYLWDVSLQCYVRIEYEGFAKLADIDIGDGYIKNHPQYYPNYFPILQILVFDGNILTKVEEYYEVQHEKEDTKYWVSITQADNGDYMLTLFNHGFGVLQTLPVDGLAEKLPDIDLEDLNLDGYTDVTISLGGTWNESHKAYLWNLSSQEYIKVEFEGFDVLAEYEVRDGYIDNFIRGDSPENSQKEKLIFDGNVLRKVDDY